MITVDHIRGMKLFEDVPTDELQTIANRAADIHLAEGDWVVSEGEVPSFFGCISGRLDVRKGTGADDHKVNEYGPGDTFGEIPLMLDSAAVVSVRALDQARVFRLDPSDFRQLVLSCPVLHGKLIETMSNRLGALQRDALETARVTVTIVGRRWDLACHDVRDFLARNHVAFVWLDPDSANSNLSIPADLRDTPIYPVILLHNGKRLVAPSMRELAEAVGLKTEPSPGCFDLAVVGAGPAGLAAAVYGASEGLHTVIFDREAPGGQAGTSSRIENYLGFPTGVSGDELGKRALQQAERFGAEIIVARDVARVEPATRGEPHTLVLEDGTLVCARAIVIATGVTWRKHDAPGIADLSGRGVYYGAARTEALATRGKRVHLVGGGNSAGQAAMFFSNYAEAVTILVRSNGLSSTMSQYLIDELARKSNVTIEPHSEIVTAQGSDHLTAIEIKDTRTGERRTAESDALFIFIGADAETSWLPDEVLRDQGGYVCTGRDVIDIIAERQTTRPWPDDRDPYLLETSVPGIFAAGDVRHGSVKRVASGVGEGSMTVAFVHQYLQTIPVPRHPELV
jgi:thioredoxin reductase (NADPH)